jgi:hypothetical protein
MTVTEKPDWLAPQAGVHARATQYQLGVRAVFHQATALQHKGLVGVDHALQAVRHADDRVARRDAAQRQVELGFGGRVER